jgi:RNA-binding protein with serine-rich domain 1
MSKRERSRSRGSRSPREGGSSTTDETLSSGPVVLHVSNLSRNVTSALLADIFSHFGTIKKCVAVIDRKVNLPKGYGFVEFADLAEAKCALLHMHGGQIDGSIVRVSIVGSDRIRRLQRRDGDDTSSASPSRSVSPPKIA